MKNKLTLGTIAVLAVFFLAISSAIVSAQYSTEKTSDISISSSGSVRVDQSSTAGSITYDISGTPGATGTVSTVYYNGNPQPRATVDDGIKLNHFIVVTFNIDASKFQSAEITIHYSNSDVAGMKTPYAIYKYNPTTNSYTKLDTVVDTAAQTITTTVTSPTDPLFAIGGAHGSSNQPTNKPTHKANDEPATISLVTWAWIVVAFETITFVVLIIGIVHQSRSSTNSKAGANTSK